MYLCIFSNHTLSFTGSQAYRVINMSHVKWCQSVSDRLCACKQNRCTKPGVQGHVQPAWEHVPEPDSALSFLGFPLELKSQLHFWKHRILHVNLFSLSISERECKAIHLENQYIFTVSAWLKVMDVSKTCRAWLCKYPSILTSLVHTILPSPDINIVTFILEMLTWKSKTKGKIKSTYLKSRTEVFPREKRFVFARHNKCQQMPTDELLLFCLVLQRGESDYTFSGKKKMWWKIQQILKTTAIVLWGIAGLGSSACVNTVSITYKSPQYFHGSFS